MLVLGKWQRFKGMENAAFIDRLSAVAPT